MLFYNPPYFNESFKISSKHVSLITPNIFQEHIIRVFVKDPAKYQLVEQAFTRLCQDRLGTTPKKGKEFHKKYSLMTQDTQMI